MLDADIEACFDRIDHTALMDRVRRRVKDKRVLRLVKAFLKAGILTELGDHEDTHTGTPQGGILSPLLANIALSVLDEHLHAPWKPGGPMSTTMRRKRRGRKGLPNWRLVRYADDFVVLVWGDRHHVAALREEITEVLAPVGLRLSEAKTQIAHMSDGFNLLGIHIQWRRKKGTNKWYVYTFVGQRPLRSVKTKIRALTRRTSQHPLGATLERINQILRGWTTYFRHAVAARTFGHLQKFVWWRVVRWQRERHHCRWDDVRRWLTDPTGRWHPISADGITLFNSAAVPIRRYRYRGNAIPVSLGTRCLNHPIGRFRGEPDAGRLARPVRRAAWGNGPGAIRAPRPRPTQPPGAGHHAGSAHRRGWVPADDASLRRRLTPRLPGVRHRRLPPAVAHREELPDVQTQTCKPGRSTTTPVTRLRLTSPSCSPPWPSVTGSSTKPVGASRNSSAPPAATAPCRSRPAARSSPPPTHYPTT